MLFIAVLLTMVLIIREKKINIIEQTIQPARSNGIFLLFFIAESVLFYSARLWFTLSELLALSFIFGISGIIFFYWILYRISSSRTRIIYTALLLLPFFITGQTLPRDSTHVIKSNKISFGMAKGSIENYYSVWTGTDQEGCNQYDTESFKEKYVVGTLGYAHTIEYLQKKWILNYGANLSFGQNTESVHSTGEELETTLADLNPYIKLDSYWVGLGGGLHLGNLIFPKGNIDDVAGLNAGINKYAIFPQFYYRFGPRRIVYFEYHLADQFPTPFPGIFHQFGLGSSFGLQNGFLLRAGGFQPSSSGELFGIYLSTYLPLSKSVSIEPSVFILEDSPQILFGVHYNLPSKTDH